MDVNPGDGVKSSVSEENMTPIDPMELSSPAVCGNKQYPHMTEDSGSQNEDLMDSTKNTDDYGVHMSETLDEKKAVSSCVLRTLQFAGIKSAERGDSGSCEKSVNPVENFPETSSDTEFSEHYLQACTETEPKDSDVEVQRKRYERNLERFSQESASLDEVGSKEKTIMSRKDIKSDGAVSKTVEFFSDASRVSSIILKANRESSSAPQSFNTEIVPERNSGVEVQLNLLNRESTKTSELIPESSKTTSDSVHSKPVSVETENKSLPGKASDYSSSESCVVFKVPDIPKCSKVNAVAIGEKIDSSGKAETKSSVLKRPTGFIFKPRKAYYTFAPGSTTGVLRCQSLPNINKEHRIETEQRRSVNLEPHLRVVKALFSDEAASGASEMTEGEFVTGAGTSTSRVASKSCSQEKFSDTKSSGNISDTLSGRKSGLNLDLPVDGGTDRVQSADITEAFVKRKEMSPMVESSAAFMKKLRSSSVKSEEDTSGKEIKDINFPSEDYQTPTCSSREKSEFNERKSSD